MSNVRDLLGRRVYGMAQVDRLLGLSPGTARRWIDGYRRAGRDYPPVVRAESTGDELVTWGEFVEARFLAGYRSLNVPMLHMRPTVERLREQLDTPYPLAQARLYAANRELVRLVQDAVDVEEPFRIVIVRNDQMMLAEPAADFVRSVDFDDAARGVVRAVHPDLDWPDIVLDPLRRFGEPTIDGIRTDILAELARAGDPPEMLAEMYQLTVDQVRTAVEFEKRHTAA